MRTFISICAVALVLMLDASCGNTQCRASDREQLIGAWKLVELDRPAPDGTLQRIDCSGMFVFTRDGHLSVQVMEREPKRAVSPAGPEQYSQGGCEASYGSYAVDERAHTFTFHVEGALVRTLVGKGLPHAYKLMRNRLIVKSVRPDEHWRVVWGAPDGCA
jgi:hypothetical protein